MKFETKFDIGQKVFIIRQSIKNVDTKCNTCKGNGKVKINNTNRQVECPDCWGNGKSTKTFPEKWRIIEESKVGRIEISKYKKSMQNKDRITYMIESTGIGSGSFYYEENVFSSEEEALKECEIRNNKLKK